jgi:hypothetical protein
MDTKFFHGNISAEDLAVILVHRFNRGNMLAQYTHSGKQWVVQIASRINARSGGDTALAVNIMQMEDGISINMGKQSWLGIAASIGISLFSFLTRNPMNIISRIDDIAQDIENLSLDDQVWAVIDETLAAFGATHELSDRLKRTGCEYCETANPVGASRCIACGAPLGNVQPRTCKKCVFVAAPEDTVCQNCSKKL